MSNETTTILNELKKINERFDTVDARFDAVDARFDAVDARFDAVDARFDAIEQNYQDVKKELVELKTGLHNVNMIIEDEIRPNINFIAEGHLDLSRKLDEALKISQDDELVRIRLNVLESDVKTIKKKLEHIA